MGNHSLKIVSLCLIVILQTTRINASMNCYVCSVYSGEITTDSACLPNVTSADVCTAANGYTNCVFIQRGCQACLTFMQYSPGGNDFVPYTYYSRGCVTAFDASSSINTGCITLAAENSQALIAMDCADLCYTNLCNYGNYTDTPVSVMSENSATEVHYGSVVIVTSVISYLSIFHL